MTNHHRPSHDARGTDHATRQQTSVTPVFIAAVLLAATLGFFLGLKVAYRQYRHLFTKPAPSSAPAESAAPEKRTAATYRGIVDAVEADRMTVTVAEGAQGAPSVTLFVTSQTVLVALRPATVSPPDRSGWDTSSKGLPPPPPAPDEPYEAQPMALKDFAVGDVVEFDGATSLEDGAAFAASRITWITSVRQDGPQGGPRGDGSAAPVLPKR